MKLISIIIPCYNYGWLLPDTLDSVLAQSYSQWECIVVDDGSVDNTKQVVSEYAQRDQRITYVHKNNGGLSSARNTGLRLAKGSYVQFLDADDLLAKRKLEVHVEYFEQNPSVDLVYSSVRYFDNGNFDALRQSLDMSLRPWMPNVSGHGYNVISRLVEGNIMVVNSPLIKREILSEANFFAESLRANEDWYLWIKCALNGANIVYFDSIDALAYVRVHETSMSQDRTRMLVGERDMRSLLRRDLVNCEYVDVINYNDTRLNEINYSLGSFYFENKQYLKAVQAFLVNAKVSGAYYDNIKHILHYFKKNIF